MCPFISVICDGVVCASLFVPCGSSVENDYPLLEKKRKDKRREEMEEEERTRTTTRQDEV